MDDLSKLFHSDQTQAAQAALSQIQWGPIVTVLLAMTREAQRQGATQAELVMLVSGFWAGMRVGSAEGKAEEKDGT